jgi:hypothetical protein
MNDRNAHIAINANLRISASIRVPFVNPLAANAPLFRAFRVFRG